MPAGVLVKIRVAVLSPKVDVDHLGKSTNKNPGLFFEHLGSVAPGESEELMLEVVCFMH